MSSLNKQNSQASLGRGSQKSGSIGQSPARSNLSRSQVQNQLGNALAGGQQNYGQPGNYAANTLGAPGSELLDRSINAGSPQRASQLDRSRKSGSPDRLGSYNGDALQASINGDARQAYNGSQDLPPGTVRPTPGLDPAVSHADLKSQHRDTIKRSQQNLQLKAEALDRSQRSLAAAHDGAETGDVRNQVAASMAQPPRGNLAGRQSYPETEMRGAGPSIGDPNGVNRSQAPLGSGLTSQIKPNQLWASPGDPNAPGASSGVTQSVPYGHKQSLDQLGNKLPLTDDQIQEQEDRDNAELASQKSKLESLQRQRPPTKQDELVQYLMKRLEAAEESIKVAEDVIRSERDLRKGTSKQLKSQIQQLEAAVEGEKRTLSDKVSAELDYTLKQAVREKVQTKQDLDRVSAEKQALQRDYEELSDMYKSMQEAQAQSEKLNDESQRLIDELEGENKAFKGDKMALQKSNIDRTERMEGAVKDYDEVTKVITQLDEARFAMNRLMGPGGTMGEAARAKYLGPNLTEHDALLNQPKGGYASGSGDLGRYNPQIAASGGTNPIHSGSGLNVLQNNPSKAYFNNAGIAGSQGNVQQSTNPYSGEADDDDFWYQGPGGGADGTGSQGGPGQQAIQGYGGNRLQ